MENLDKLTGVLVDLLTTIQNTAKEQWPSIAEEILKYEAWEAQKCIYIGMFLLIMFLLFSVITVASDSVGAAFIAFVFGLTGSIVTVGNYFTINKIEKAPKVFLIEYVTHKTIKN